MHTRKERTMNVHLTTKTLDTQTQRRRQRVAAWGLALLAVVAVGSWQVAVHRDGTRTADVEHRPVSATPVTRPVVTTGTDRTSPLTVYLVSSADEAAWLRETIAEGDRILNQ